MAIDTIDDLLRSAHEYTREQFEQDRRRLAREIAFKRNVRVDEVDDLIREHRYEHVFGCPEDEYLEMMSFARAVGWI